MTMKLCYDKNSYALARPNEDKYITRSNDLF